MSTHIITHIKKQVEDSKQKQYTINKEKKELKYYSLYLSEVVKIQRFFRNYLAKKTRVLQNYLSHQLQQRQYLHFQQQNLNAEIQQQKSRRQKLMNLNMAKAVEYEKQNISQNIRNMIKNIVYCADKYSKNAAISKLALGELQNRMQQQKQLKAEIKQLLLQKQCYEQRISNWSEKLKQIRQKIIIENSIKNQLLSKFSQ